MVYIVGTYGSETPLLLFWQNVRLLSQLFFYHFHLFLLDYEILSTQLFHLYKLRCSLPQLIKVGCWFLTETIGKWTWLQRCYHMMHCDFWTKISNAQSHLSKTFIKHPQRLSLFLSYIHQCNRRQMMRPTSRKLSSKLFYQHVETINTQQW